MKIYGEIWPAYRNGADYYKIGDYRHDSPIRLRPDLEAHIGGSFIVGCSGKATQLLHPGINGTIDYGPVTDVMSWGYDGRGSELLAAYLIATAFCRRSSGLDESRTSWVDPAVIELVHRHYKQFSTEVIANLPDEWEMDMDWVKEWVMEREKTEVKA